VPSNNFVPSAMTGQQSNSSPSVLTQAAIVGVACASELTFFYPTWVAAKRLGAGLGWPRGRELYRGSVAVWLSYFPTLACDDLATRLLQPSISSTTSGRLGASGEQLIASAVAGAAAGLIVGAPTEGVVTRAHCLNIPVIQCLRETLQSKNGVRRLLLPHGQAAMVGREVPFSVGVFFLRDYFSAFFHGHEHHHHHTSSEPTKATSTGAKWWAEEVAASTATAVALNIFAHPPSALLALQQGHEMPIRTALKTLYSNGGLLGFYVGFGARTFTMCGSMFMIPTVMRLGAAFFADDHHVSPKVEVKHRREEVNETGLMNVA
jgi:hypothetical protein